MSSSALIRQDLVPMIGGYVLIMGALALGLRIARRHPVPDPDAARQPNPAPVPAPASGREASPAGPVSGPVSVPAAGPARRGLRAVIRPGPGWGRLILHYLATAVGGYLLLVIIIILYYYEVSPVAGNFVQSAFTGCAMLIGLSLPVFLAASWLAERTGWRF